MIPRAAYFRAVGRANLGKQHWWAVLITLVAGVLGATTVGTGSISFRNSIDFRNTIDVSDLPDIPAGSFDYKYILDILERFSPFLLVLGAIILIFSLISLAIHIFVSGPTEWGYRRYCLQMHDGTTSTPFRVLFSGFRHMGKMIGLYWWIQLKLFLWALAAIAVLLLASIIFTITAITGFHVNYFVISFLLSLCLILCMIPMIRAAYAYSMSFYLMVENPDLSVFDCVKASVALMRGNKWRLFCLNFSFIGWHILNGITAGILGILYLNPYVEFAQAAFYRSLVPAHPATRLWEDCPMYNDPLPEQPTQNPPAFMPPERPIGQESVPEPPSMDYFPHRTDF